MSSLPRRTMLAASLVAAAATGYLIGAATAPAAPLPEPSGIPVAAIPTSTPELRTPLPAATPTPTSPPSRTAPAGTGAPATIEATPAPEAIVPRSPTPVPVPTRLPGGGALVYVARAGEAPLAAAVAGAGAGATPAERVLSRLRALPKASPPPGTLNLAARSGASLIGVSIDPEGTVTLQYALQGGTWGFASPEDLVLLLQQIVFTATEEPGVDSVILRRFGGRAVPIRPDETWMFGAARTREDVLAPR